MELKTLKDLFKYEVNGNDFRVEARELRQEAIKWIKAFYLNEGLDKWRNFMIFFDITEEDLK